MPPMSAPAPLAAPPNPQAETCADTHGTVTDSPPVRHRGRASCAFCGQAWFGEVAYCPYCGHASSGVGVDRSAAALQAADGHAMGRALAVDSARHEAMQGAGALRSAGELRLSGPRADEPGGSWKSGWKPTVAVIAALAVIAVTVDRLSDTGRHPTSEAISAPAPTPAEVIPPPGATRDGPATSVQALPTEPPPPRADRDSQPQPQPQASPPAPQRSLCSAASAAAGLCNPQ